jgi:anti-sigma regulatory factor (Ser/Thr protein kinase)
MNAQTRPQQHRIRLSDSSQAGEARRTATRAAQQAGLGEADCGRVAIVASELASNALRHAGGGEILINTTNSGAPKGIEMVAIDRGPGIADLARCMADGYSTAGSLGHGLGAIRRLSTMMDIYSAPARGTAIYARVEAQNEATNTPVQEPSWWALSVPAPGETECGDGWELARSPTLLSAAVADGLGHGPLAAQAANAAMATFQRNPFAPPERYLASAHEEVRTTRGAALACAQVDIKRRKLLFAGVGNISASLFSNSTQSHRALTSHNGTIGLQLGRVQQFEYSVLEDDLLVMHSDGLTARWKLADYPGLPRRSPALIAAILYRDFNRGRDDATVLVARLK